MKRERESEIKKLSSFLCKKKIIKVWWIKKREEEVKRERESYDENKIIYIISQPKLICLFIYLYFL